MTTKDLKERTDAEKAAAAPINLPAGSYTIEDLEKLSAAATKAAPEKRDAVVAEGVAAANLTVTNKVEPHLEAGFEFVDVEREDLGVTERIQVRAKPAGETEEETAEIDAKVMQQQADAAEPADKGKPTAGASAGKE